MDSQGITILKQVVPGAGSLVEQIDKLIFVWLRDGHRYIATLRSVDQFANLVLHNTYERIQIKSECGDQYLGVIVVRGENVALLGEVGSDVKINELPEALFADYVTKELGKEEIEKLKVEAYRKRGMIYVPEDNF